MTEERDHRVRDAMFFTLGWNAGDIAALAAHLVTLLALMPLFIAYDWWVGRPLGQWPRGPG